MSESEAQRTEREAIEACPVCTLVKVLGYARSELERLDLAYRQNPVDIAHRPIKVVTERAQFALDTYRVHGHHLSFKKKKA